jgi:transcriptional regulator with XRE-family HTH domain
MTSTVGAYAVETGKRMRAVREARGMTLAQVEKASDGRWLAISLGMWERGQRGIRVETLAGYAQWLGVDIRLLLPPGEGAGEWRQAVVTDAADAALRVVSGTIASITAAEASQLLVSALTDREAS